MNVYRKNLLTQKFGIKLNTIKYICFNYKWKKHWQARIYGIRKSEFGAMSQYFCDSILVRKIKKEESDHLLYKSEYIFPSGCQLKAARFKEWLDEVKRGNF